MKQLNNFSKNKQSVLITGAAGFLGTYLAQVCVDEGYQIYGIDHKLPKNPELWTNFIQGSTSQVDFKTFLHNVELSLCFHLAGSALVAYSIQEPFQDFNKLLPGTAKLLEYIVRNQPQCHFILFSSAAVYGNPKVLPISETELPAPISPYGVHKQLAESLLQSYSAIYGITCSILRIFSAYGVGLRKQLFWDILSKYYEQAPQEQQSITLFGTGNESRDFIHGFDIARAAILVGQNPQPKQVQIINIANGQEITIKDAAVNLFKSFPEEVKIHFNNQVRPGDPSRWVADISKLTAMNYKPTIDLSEGLGEYSLWYKNQRYQELFVSVPQKLVQHAASVELSSRK
ncbi:NAD-dependent epimerase/dehydratase family protein [Gloeocapsa sp. BRSZ]